MKFNFVKEGGGDGRGKTYAKRAVFITVNCRILSIFYQKRREKEVSQTQQVRRLGSSSSHDENDNVKKQLGTKQ